MTWFRSAFSSTLNELEAVGPPYSALGAPTSVEFSGQPTPGCICHADSYTLPSQVLIKANIYQQQAYWIPDIQNPY